MILISSNVQVFYCSSNVEMPNSEPIKGPLWMATNIINSSC